MNSVIVDFKPITETALENGTDVQHQRLFLEKPITEAGYVYVWLSNEGEELREVYFDDFKVEHLKSAVIQSQDFYPFGAIFNEYQRENRLNDQYKFNDGSERQDELDLQIDLTEYRAYDPWGRLGWWQIDPKADSLSSFSPYHYSFNNPIRYNDPKGDCPPDSPCNTRAGNVIKSAFQSNVTGNAQAALNSASQVFSGSVGVQAAGIGGNIKVSGIIHVEATGRALTGDASMSSNDPDGSIAAVKTEFGLELGPTGGSYGQDDMKYDGQSFQMRDGSGSYMFGSVEYGSGSNEISIGGTLGNISAEISANIDALKDAGANVIESIKGFLKNYLPNPLQE